MKFVRVTALGDCIEPLRNRLMKELAEGKQVLWLVPGGSNIPLSVAVMSQLPDEMTARLTIMLTDERFGTVGHADSNARQLDETGFLPKQAAVYPVLRDGLELDATCDQYAADYLAATRQADIVIGQFGMGADGHIAGILPGSPAASSADLTAGYKAPGFTRITLTPKALQQVTVAFVIALGDSKRDALQQLRDSERRLDEQPAQLVRHLPESYVYNDQFYQIGDRS